jgi:plasmid maintenance system killer protein
MFTIQVDCYAGYRGEETPRMICFKQRIIRVVEVMDRWLSPDHRYFKIRGDDDGVYIIRHDCVSAQWQLTFYKHLKTSEARVDERE